MENRTTDITVIFSFVGRVPSPFSTSKLFCENALAKHITWNDPGTAGSALLRDILAKQNSCGDENYRNTQVTAILSTDDERRKLLSLIGVATKIGSNGVKELCNADLLLEFGMLLASSLYRVEVKSTRLVQNAFAAVTKRVSVRHMFIMNQHGLCFVVDPEVHLDPSKLKDSKFFCSEDALNKEGIQCWGENGGERWRSVVGRVDSNLMAIFEFGSTVLLGRNPEDKINGMSLDELSGANDYSV